MNPIPNKAPYTVTVGGKTVLQPLRHPRGALRHELPHQPASTSSTRSSAATAQPMFTMATPGPARHLQVQPHRLEVRLHRDRQREEGHPGHHQRHGQGLRASRAQGQAGEEQGDWWTFNGEPVTLKFLIRVDDPNGRLKEGRYIADQVEKAGLKVERLEMDRAKCSNASTTATPPKLRVEPVHRGLGRRGDPGVVGQHRLPDVRPVVRLHARRRQPRASGTTRTRRSTSSPRRRRTASTSPRTSTGTCALKATELGLQDAVRIYVAAQQATT